MTTKKNTFKQKLYKKLLVLNGLGFYQIIADRAELSHEAVRQWFTIEQRKNSDIEKTALELLEELRSADKEKHRKVES